MRNLHDIKVPKKHQEDIDYTITQEEFEHFSAALNCLTAATATITYNTFRTSNFKLPTIRWDEY